jgi:hypothetical protein
MDGDMLVYKVFYKNYKLKKGEFIGLLVERRKDLRGKTQIESGLRWARLTFGRMLKDERTIFIIPNDLKLEDDTQRLMEKGVLTKGELFEMGKPVDQEAKRSGDRQNGV